MANGNGSGWLGLLKLVWSKEGFMGVLVLVFVALGVQYVGRPFEAIQKALVETTRTNAAALDSIATSTETIAASTAQASQDHPVMQETCDEILTEVTKGDGT